MVWVLLAFDCIAAALSLLIPNRGEASCARFFGSVAPPDRFLALLAIIPALGFVPLAFGL